METTQLLLNDQLVTISADSHTIKKLNEDDRYLADYVNRAAKMGQFHFLFAKEPTLRRIVVKRLPDKQVWCRKGRPSEDDMAASCLLLRLRNSEKYSPRFKEGYLPKGQLWEEIAKEMRSAGFEVDGKKCSQKFLHLVQNYQKNSEEFCGELKKICGESKRCESDDDDEEEPMPKTRKRKRTEDDEESFFKKYLKKSHEQKEERFKELCNLVKRRNDILEEKLKQNRDIIDILGRLIKG